MFRLALNAGHGRNTAGKRCLKSIDPNETREWILNSRICDKIQVKLSTYDGIEVKRMDDVTGVVDRTIATRTKTANTYGADFYLSVHHNAGIHGGTGGGIVAYTYLSVDNKTKEWQKALYQAAITHSGLKGNRATPLASQDLGECRETSMPAVLMECGFMDSVVDTPIILTDQFAEQMADAFVEVLVNFSGAKPKKVPDASAKPEEVSQLYRVRASANDAKSQVGAYRVLNNAISAAKKTNLCVFDTAGNCVWKPDVTESATVGDRRDATLAGESKQTSSDESEQTEKKNFFTSLYSFIKHFFK